MGKQLVILILLCSLSAQAQEKYNWKRAIVPASLSFAGGALWGVNQVNAQHPEQMFAKWPGLSRKRWGNDSWKNKYIDGDPEKGRTAVPIWFTDWQHATASATQLSMFGAGVSIPLCRRRGKWWHYAADAGISFGAYSLGNYLTYSIIMR